MPFNTSFLERFPEKDFTQHLKNEMCSIFSPHGMILSIRANFPGAIALPLRCFLQHKTQLCALDQKNTPDKGGESRARPVKI